MSEEIAPTFEGWERLQELIDIEKSGSDRYPAYQVDIVVQYDGPRGSRTVEGTLLSVRGSLEQDREKREQQRYDGWFGKVRSPDGFVNVYASPGSGGPSVIHTPDWDGRQGRPGYKYPIQEIVIDPKPDTEPQCFACHSTMQFGMFHDAPEDHHGPAFGWICPDCTAGCGLGRFREYGVEQGLP